MCCDVAGFQSVGNEEEITLGVAGGSLTSCPIHQCVSGEMEEEQLLSQLETFFFHWPNPVMS